MPPFDFVGDFFSPDKSSEAEAAQKEFEGGRDEVLDGTVGEVSHELEKMIGVVVTDQLITPGHKSRMAGREKGFSEKEIGVPQNGFSYRSQRGASASTGRAGKSPAGRAFRISMLCFTVVMVPLLLILDVHLFNRSLEAGTPAYEILFELAFADALFFIAPVIWSGIVAAIVGACSK
jgi:hypothetical protein